MKKVLVPIDDSDMQSVVLAEAKSIAEHFPESEILLLTVVPPFIPSANCNGAYINELASIAFENAEKMLGTAKESFGDLADRVSVEADGNPDAADAIIKASEGCDLIVIGTRGLSGLREYVGSVSHKVIHKSKCPVLLAK